MSARQKAREIIIYIFIIEILIVQLNIRTYLTFLLRDENVKLGTTRNNVFTECLGFL